MKQDMKQYIGNVLRQYRDLKRQGHYGGGLARHLGALECALLVVGALDDPFPYKTKEYIAWSLFFVLRRTRQETYAEMIERVATEWLAEQGDADGEGKAS
jgi:hypothetical protein